MSKFYDGTKLLSLMDISGKKPEIYMCTSNRNGGKTTYFSRLCVNRYLKYGEKFCIIYRFNYELDDCADNFFKDIGGLFFPDHEMTNERRASGTYHELFLDGCSCGYAVALNNADSLKKKGHMFSDTMRMFFDEFQSETNHYCNDEVAKFRSIHTSIARGGGKQVRYLPVYMLSNPVSLLNTYYTALKIYNKLSNDTKFLRGIGFVVEQGYVESASQAQKESAFNRAFGDDKYTAYLSENLYLNDNTAFIEKPQGKSTYIATLRYKGTDYAIRSYASSGYVYCDKTVDETFPIRIAVTTDDHSINYVMLRNIGNFVSKYRTIEK